MPINDSVKILCHRGIWADPAERNSLSAFEAAWGRHWGIETDVRDYGGELVISHDPPRGDEMSLAELMKEWSGAGADTTIALNIKADGLARRVNAEVGDENRDHMFVFDMSVPDFVEWTNVAGSIGVYTRWSDLEPIPTLVERSAGVWLDAFEDDLFWDSAALAAHLQAGRRVVVVSPELHGRDPQRCWDRLAGLDACSHPGLSICTDRPQAAERFFS